MRIEDFFNQNPVFRVEELDSFLGQKGKNAPQRRNSLLAYHRKKGRIINIKRSLYAVCPYDSSPDTLPVDPYLLAAKITQDGVLAYHSALEFYGRSYSVFNRFYYLSNQRAAPVRFRDYEFHCVRVPLKLREKNCPYFAVDNLDRLGTDARVTSLERTLVDVLDRPDISGSWEEIWRSLESVEFFDIDKIIEYTLLLENATTAAKVGLFLDQHRDTLMVQDNHLKRLYDLKAKQPCYLERSKRQSGRLVSDWNIVVPENILNRTWSEVL